MPCNLAVTITKALVLPEHLQQLLTPEITAHIVETYLKGLPQFATSRISVTRIINQVHVSINFGEVGITIRPNQIIVRHSRSQSAADQLQTDVQTLLSKAADQLFAQQVKTSLTTKFKKVKQTNATVDNQGTPQQVTVFSLEI